MSNQLTNVLKKFLKKRKIGTLESGTGKIVRIVFRKKGDYTSKSSVRNVWKRVFNKAGLENRKFHTVRHTFASILISQGEPLA